MASTTRLSPRTDIDHEIIEACQRGDQDAFRVLFESHKDRVYSLCLRYSGNPATALDLAQDVFLKLWSKMGEFRGESSFETWLYRLVVNTCVDSRRRGWRLIPFADTAFEAIRATGESALSQVLRDEREQSLQDVVAKLPPDQRLVVVLRYTEGLSYEEIADVLGCSRGTVASRLNRAHKTLERRLEHLRASYGQEQ